MIILKNMKLSTLMARMGCHRLPDRSFKIWGRPMPFCARCFGASVGHIVSFVLFCAGLLLPLTLCLSFMLIIFVDWFLQERFAIMSTNPRRFVTGIIGGIGVGSIWWISFNYLIRRFI